MNYRLNNEVNESLTASNLNFSFALEIDESLDPFLPRQRGGRTGAWRALHLLASGVHDRFAKFSPEFPATGRAKTMVHRAGETGGRSERGARERERAGAGRYGRTNNDRLFG